MRYDLNLYAVVEDISGLHLVPSYKSGSYLEALYTVLLTSAPLLKASGYLDVYAATRNAGGNEEAAQRAASSLTGAGAAGAEAAAVLAFELGFRCAERGLNLEAGVQMLKDIRAGRKAGFS